MVEDRRIVGDMESTLKGSQAAFEARMDIRNSDPLMAFQLSRAELVLLNNALNEALHGVGIEEPEFSTRLGASRLEAQKLLERIGLLLETISAIPPGSGQ